jgi:hypothetical protein
VEDERDCGMEEEYEITFLTNIHRKATIFSRNEESFAEPLVQERMLNRRRQNSV